MRHRGSPHLPWAKPEQTLEQTTSPRACGPLPLVQIQPMVLRPMPYAQSYNGGSLSQFSSVETETPLSKHSVSQRLPGFAQEGEHNRLSSCLHHVRLVWAPMLLLPAQPHTLPPFLSGACSVCGGGGLHLLLSLLSLVGNGVPRLPPRASGETAGHRKMPENLPLSPNILHGALELTCSP